MKRISQKSCQLSLAGFGILYFGWLIGQFTRDSTWLGGLCFYVPSVLVATVLFMFSSGAFIKKRFRWGILAAFLAVPALFTVLFVENSFSRPNLQSVDSVSPIRLVHWNIFGGQLGLQEVQQSLASLEPEIIVLSEFPGDASLENFAKLFGENYSAVSEGNLAVIARGQLLAHGWHSKSQNSKFWSVTWNYQGQTVSVVVADILANVSVHRNPELKKLTKILTTHKPDFLVGDLNSPRRSLALSQLPLGYQHAYHSAGSGIGYTWPVPLPIYSLDHCIHGPRIVLVGYELHSTIRSDHRLQVFDFLIIGKTPFLTD